MESMPLLRARFIGVNQNFHSPSVLKLLLFSWCESLLGQKQLSPFGDAEIIQMTGCLEVVVGVVNMKTLTGVGDHALLFFG